MKPHGTKKVTFYAARLIWVVIDETEYVTGGAENDLPSQCYPIMYCTKMCRCCLAIQLIGLLLKMY
jgi:hypothetical protein